MISQGTLYIGIMSGTSLDGIDVALVDVQADNVKLLSSLEYPIPDALRRTL